MEILVDFVQCDMPGLTQERGDCQEMQGEFLFWTMFYRFDNYNFRWLIANCILSGNCVVPENFPHNPLPAPHRRLFDLHPTPTPRNFHNFKRGFLYTTLVNSKWFFG